ncbi:MAG TPA: phosphohistidine phosphatase SixA [Bacteroidota bacterium]
MNVYLLRHAIAVLRGTEEYERDSDRPLTPKGEKKMHRIAEGMKAMGLSFDVILSSPVLRARQTAEIAAEVLGQKKRLEFLEALSTSGDPEDVVNAIQKKYTSCEDILLVGHEPDMSALISVLLSGDDNLAITMKKGGLCKLTIDEIQFGKCATLEWLLAPKQLIRLA